MKLWLALVLAFCSTGCSLASLLEQNAAAIKDASSAMRGTQQSIDAMSEDLRKLQPSMDKLGTLEAPLGEAAKLREPLEELAELRAGLEQVAGLRQSLSEVASLRRSLDEVIRLKSSLDRLIEMRESLDRVVDVGGKVANLYELREPLETMASLEPTLIKLTKSIDKMEKISAPLESMGGSLDRTLGALTPVLEIPVWLIAFGILLLLVLICVATCAGTYLAMRMIEKSKAERSLRTD